MLNNSLIKMKINQILNSNPQARELYNNLKGKSNAELKEYAQNVAQSRGIDLGQFLNQFGLKM